MKTRANKAAEYEAKYQDVPRDQRERLNWLCDQLHITTDKQYHDILAKRNLMLSNMYYSVYQIVLYEEPEGSPRPRARMINRSNLAHAATVNPYSIQIYSLTGDSDRKYMSKLLSSDEVYHLESIIYTPCDVEYTTFSPIPSYFTKTDKILAEIGLIRPLAKPDWDNMGKKYSDMYTGNVWVDDVNVIRGVVDKYYSCLPRVEIKLMFLNTLYTTAQYKQISHKLGDDSLTYLNNKGVLVND